ncbi:MAG: RNA ligase RtcB family protein [Candidatus Electrothrix aestuarii]|uniref:3'-phosphate/5'-hydroxy nucleic acid ligase n=1 Tax=Candidatus Electrothrix aestuarii TaxID=3062594 RepID=A0AAU8LVA7_9BACT|nr:RNA ligase RtcB family protein [Candidatus Electrothrix aestuarii]
MTNPATIRIIASEENRMEGEAVQQLEQVAQLPGMHKVIGLPDLHPGKGGPIGGAFFSQGILYPYLIGNDIGCGMGFWQTNLKQRKAKRDRWVKKLHGLEEPWEGDPAPWLTAEGLAPSGWDAALGTIGGGNHFVELQSIASIEDKEAFVQAGLESGKLFLLVHSGSRGLGQHILNQHIEQYRNNGLEVGSEAAAAYLEQHGHALQWARLNRAIIADRFLDMLGTEGERILDRCHNSVTPMELEGFSGWLHRKGAAPSDEGLMVIPGSRGSHTYLVQPTGSQEENCFSLAHGAGRKWKRSGTRSRLKDKYTCESLLQTSFGSRVICEDRDLLYEEAPQAYKNISVIVQDLQDAGLLKVLAVLQPLITYKVRKEVRKEARKG